MKLIIAIVNDDDSHSVLSELTRQSFSVTKLSTTGGFLRVGNTTLMIGVSDNKTDEALEIIRNCSRERIEYAKPAPSYTDVIYVTPPIEVKVGGATVFVLDVDKFVKF